ncbi:hypothetical protein KY321_01425 [Candidatus Woesearchaeota archaeon]|nr:hypothetical protein [Candidatus Woesearchaeota archaeon]
MIKKIIKSKKAQLQMLESTMVMFILFFLIILGIVFYNNVLNEKYKNMGEKFNDYQAIQIVQKISSIPELQCTKNGLLTQDCYDVGKLANFERLWKRNPTYYRKEYGLTQAKVTLVYSPSLDVQNGFETYPEFFTIPNTDQLDKTRTIFNFTSTIVDDDYEMNRFNYPIILMDSRFFPEKYYFGWLTIEVFAKSE